MNVQGIISSRYFPGLAVTLILGSIYAFTLLPGPGYSGDTVKFQFVGHVLGTPHGSGYPTYVVLNHWFTGLLPFGSVALKANLFSSVFSILASLVLLGTLSQLGIRGLIATVTTVSFGLGLTVWSQSVVAEVYSLNLLFVAGMVYCFLRWHLEKDDRFFYSACALYAISFGNHLTMITFLPAIIYFVWATDRRVFLNPRKIVWVLFVIIFGAAQYFYVFLRTASPTTPYLEMTAPDLKTFWFYVTGGQFKHFLFALPFSWVVLEKLPALFLFTLRELAFAIPLPFFGSRSLQNPQVRRFLWLCLAGTFLFALAYAIPDIDVYLIPAYFILAIFSVAGLQYVSTWFTGRFRSYKPWFVVVLPFSLAIMNVNSVYQRTNTTHDITVKEALQAVNGDAIVVCPDYHSAMFFWYHVFIDGWKDKNIHVVFFHDLRFPAKEMSEYVFHNLPFEVPVTRDVVPAGLPVYLFNGVLEVGGEGYHDSKTELALRQRQLSEVGLRLVQKNGEFYRVLPVQVETLTQR